MSFAEWLLAFSLSDSDSEDERFAHPLGDVPKTASTTITATKDTSGHPEKDAEKNFEKNEDDGDERVDNDTRSDDDRAGDSFQEEEKLYNSPLSPSSSTTTSIAAECVICNENEANITLKCGHEYCSKCLRRELLRLTESKRKMVCFECDTELETTEIQLFALRDDINAYTEMLVLLLLEGSPDNRYCLNPECGKASLMDNQQGNIFCCPYCKERSCTDCQVLWNKEHKGLTCKQYQSMKKRSEKQTRKFRHQDKKQQKQSTEWVVKHTQKCPNCAVNIQKADGCNHMRCTRCHHEFCWACLNAYIRDINTGMLRGHVCKPNAAESTAAKKRSRWFTFWKRG